MNKRKSNTQTLDSDMVFEDDDENDEQSSIAGLSSESTRVSGRSSGRAKKAKAIYDPSEYNGPVHKRKKDAVEAEKNAKAPVVKSVAKASETVKKEIPKPIAPPVKNPVVQLTQASPPKATVEPKKETKKQRSSPQVKTKMPIELNKKPIEQVPKPVIVPTAPVAKEPSKRIQARKQKKVTSVLSLDKPLKKKTMRVLSTSTAVSSSDYDNASTIEYKQNDIPDVRQWTYQQVSNYFNQKLGFTKSDSAIFTNEEIDGETLMIMKRSDIVTNKFQQLKLGTALKMWSQIIKFQTGEFIELVILRHDLIVVGFR